MEMQFHNQIERITYYEQKLVRCTETIEKLHGAIIDFYAIQEDIDELEQYYTGSQWRRDFEDDTEGRLPRTLKRGVLSEDGISDILDDNLRMRAILGPGEDK